MNRWMNRWIKFKINFNINVSLMTVRYFWWLIYLIVRLEKDNVCTLKLNLFYINLIFLIMEKIFYTVKTYVFRFEESFIDLNKSNKMKSKFFFVLTCSNRIIWLHKTGLPVSHGLSLCASFIIQRLFGSSWFCTAVIDCCLDPDPQVNWWECKLNYFLKLI